MLSFRMIHSGYILMKPSKNIFVFSKEVGQFFLFFSGSFSSKETSMSSSIVVFGSSTSSFTFFKYVGRYPFDCYLALFSENSSPSLFHPFNLLFRQPLDLSFSVDVEAFLILGRISFVYNSLGDWHLKTWCRVDITLWLNGSINDP